AGAIGSGAGLAAALLVTLAVRRGWIHLDSPIRPLYLLAGVLAVIAAGACLGIPRDLKTPGPALVVRRKYSLYYLLCFLEGWRKQIFITFAGFLLTKTYHTPISTMLLLWLATNVIGWFISPRVGRLIDRIGERKVLITYFACLTMVFIGYALIPNKWALYTLFVADSCFFSLGMGLTTYVRRIAPASEHTPTLSMGVAMNHVAAVAMPLVGGWLWSRYDSRWTFLMGSVVAFASIFVAMRVPRRDESAVSGQWPVVSKETRG
ncbi:MAG: MFS transporter, partial [Phycisphaerae bacterium]|nr:MFS transporter [Phycisphaerae bacterium]